MTVTYTVGLGNVEVSDNVYEGLTSQYKFDPDDTSLTEAELEALEWLADHIEERDAMDWNYEVDID